MSLVELIAQADERGLAASGLACLDRCVPVLGGDDDVLRPLWASLAEGGDWTGPLAEARSALGSCAGPADRAAGGGASHEAVTLTRRMLDAAPAGHSGAEVREWADGCSVAALQVHRLLDTAPSGATRSVAARREGRADGTSSLSPSPQSALSSPLVAAELRRQVRILELLSNRGAGPAGGLRQALDVSMEGRRVLRAVVSRRARGRG
ncbi:hypothetical protein ABZV77_06995 [Streptomyces sp. NPDC004732]|uniref:hypothetical protein n=1 Tax=Streptomyces sp. NPDC004732 TaxID=3154290 RepID=UPI0033BCCB2D